MIPSLDSTRRTATPPKTSTAAPKPSPAVARRPNGHDRDDTFTPAPPPKSPIAKLYQGITNLADKVNHAFVDQGVANGDALINQAAQIVSKVAHNTGNATLATVVDKVAAIDTKIDSAVVHFLGGVVKGFAATPLTVAKLAAGTAYAATDEKFRTQQLDAAKAIVSNPGAVVSNIVKEVVRDPAQFVGELVGGYAFAGGVKLATRPPSQVVHWTSQEGYLAIQESGQINLATRPFGPMSLPPVWGGPGVYTTVFRSPALAALHGIGATPEVGLVIDTAGLPIAPHNWIAWVVKEPVSVSSIVNVIKP